MKKVGLVAITTLLAFTSINQSNAAILGESLNGKTINLKINTTFNLKLSSTYWQLANLKSNDFITQIGTETVTLVKPGPSAPAGCKHPGSGCGTISWKFKATKTGTTKISAFRSSCGEALKCTAKEQNFQLTIKVIN